jgi:hypothetical protein
LIEEINHFVHVMTELLGPRIGYVNQIGGRSKLLIGIDGCPVNAIICRKGIKSIVKVRSKVF